MSFRLCFHPSISQPSSSNSLSTNWKVCGSLLFSRPLTIQNRFRNPNSLTHGISSRLRKHPSLLCYCSFSEIDGSSTNSQTDSEAFSNVSPNESVSSHNDLFEFLTSERVKVVALLGLALALCNADRVVMSVAIVPLSSAYGWSRSFSGVVQSSFLWGYLISPIAGGALVDYYGGKIVMAWGVAIWSVATFLTPWAADRSLWALLSMRVLLGIAEGVALPSMNNMVSRWFPQTERSRAVALAMAGFHLGSAMGLVISPIIMSQAGIFGPFVIFGLFGFLWVLVWLSATSSTPVRHRQVSKDELDYILSKNQKPVIPVLENKSLNTRRMPPFRLLLSKLPSWALIVANAMHSWGFFIMLSWMPIYFNTVYRVDLREAAWFSAFPWVMMAVLGYVAGAASDMLIRMGSSVTFTRKVMQSIGFIGPGIALLGLSSARSPSVASAWLTMAISLNSFSHAGFLVNLQEIAPQYAGVLHDRKRKIERLLKRKKEKKRQSLDCFRVFRAQDSTPPTTTTGGSARCRRRLLHPSPRLPGPVPYLGFQILVGHLQL